LDQAASRVVLEQVVAIGAAGMGVRVGVGG
jgi:hypothetical protein